MPPGIVDGKGYLRAGFCACVRLSYSANVDAVLLHDRCDFLGNIGIFVAEQLRAGVHDGNTAAEAAKQLPKLQADVTAAKNQQMFRKLRSSMIEVLLRYGTSFKAFNCGNRGRHPALIKICFGGKVRCEPSFSEWLWISDQ